MTEFTPVSALAGGVLIGLAAAMLLLLHGRIMGISGILGQFLKQSEHTSTDGYWRFWFLSGVIAGPLLAGILLDDLSLDASNNVLSLPDLFEMSIWEVLAGGILVGLGTQMGAGCTSGHGVCGIGRFSVRSIVATLVFMSVAGITVFVVRHLLVFRCPG